MKIYSNFFSYIPFWHQKIHNNTFETKSNIGQCCFFSRYRLLNGQPIFNCEILQNFA